MPLLSNKYVLAGLMVTVCLGAWSFIFNDSVDYNTEVKPIINKKCISCHGGVKKKAGFSLLFRSEALAPTESGKPAIIPGDPGASEMIRRLTLHDPEERMPYKEEPLSEEEISILTKWVKQGAKWGDHWAYVPVAAPEVPVQKGWLGLFPSKHKDWVKNEIDWFILDKLRDKDLEPSNEADKQTLLRRAALDIIGMPAPEAIGAWYLQNKAPDAYEKLVDTLLQLPAYGERWAGMWLDLARYADTKGYERDDIRYIWRYRDWLIKSFNEDKPYDVFLQEQLAGDMLPNPTDEQLIATAFHRNTMTNDEGGTDNEEFRIAAVLDRVNTTWEVLMGTSFNCVQCHSHPYDPFKHEEYYKFMAFFNNTRDEDTYSDYPVLYEYNKEDTANFRKFSDWAGKHLSKQEADVVMNFVKTKYPSYNSLKSDRFVNAELVDTKWLGMRDKGEARVANIHLTGKTRMLFRYIAFVPDGKLEIHTDSLNGPLLLRVDLPQSKDFKWTVYDGKIPSFTGNRDLYFRYRSSSLKKDYTGIFFDWLHFTTDFPHSKPGADSAYKWYYRLVSAGNATVTPIMLENPDYMRRTTRIFERGNWTAQTGEVQPDVPGSLIPMPADAPRNRLGLARWITDKKNPLTSRTIVNRIWEQLFGQGIAETLEDMGTQGIPPTHPELLDHLSYRLMFSHDWSLKKLIREIVTSATYRQDSRVTPEGLEKDRFNKYYARGPRVRLSAEQIRDQALAVSGAMDPQLYGPSAKPWQPDGIWNSPYSGHEQWENDLGSSRFRRGLYTYWKRTSAYPSMLNFDAMAREVCTSRRIRTNTPLQALTLLNDKAYLDISREFAYNLRDKKLERDAAIREAFTKAVGRPPTPADLQTFTRLYETSLSRYRADADATCEMVGLQNEYNNAETAALIVVVNSIMNLDEVITKP